MKHSETFLERALIAEEMDRGDAMLLLIEAAADMERQEA